MNGSYAYGDGFDHGGGGDLRRSRLASADRGRGGGFGGGGFGGGMSDFHAYNNGGGGHARSGSLYGGDDVDPRHYGGGGDDYGAEYYGGRGSHFSEDPRYGGRGGGRPHPHDFHGGGLMLPPDDGTSFYSNDDSLDSSSSSLKTPPPSSPTPEGSRPGVQFCSSHAAVSAKIAAFDGKNPAAAPQIEIAPGLTARLRGAKETWEAVENDFYMPTQCFCCQTDLFCIMDANYVLCPSCKVVSPLEGCAKGMSGGVGLGFTYQDLQQWQYEIVMRRQRR